MQALIDDTGLASLSIGGHVALLGGVEAVEACAVFGLPASQSLGPILSRTIQQLTAGSWIVRQIHQFAEVEYRYTVEGDDVECLATVTNRGSADMRMIGFTGLEIDWDGVVPVGIFTGPFWEDSYLLVHGRKLMHPGSDLGMNVGCIYGKTPAFGLSVCPVGHGLARSFMYTRWEPFGEPTAAPQSLRIYFETLIQPGASKSFAFNIRASENTDWHYLLEPYRQQFVQSFGGLRYAPDDRPSLKMPYADLSSVGPTNPYGFHLGRRFDTAMGAQEWIDTRMPLMQQATQGCLFWILNGYDARIAPLEYSPEVHLLPPEIEANRPALAAAFAAANLRLGRLGQPQWITEKNTWATDRFFEISVDSQSQLDEVWRRFSLAIDAGFTSFYLDSVALNLDHVCLVDWFRTKAGPSVLTWTEHVPDVCLPATGAYAWVDGTPGNYQVHLHGEVFFTDPACSIVSFYRWLVPGCSILASVPDGILTADVAGLLDWMYAKQVTPLVDDWLHLAGIPTLGDELASRNAQHLTDNHW